MSEFMSNRLSFLAGMLFSVMLVGSTKVFVNVKYKDQLKTLKVVESICKEVNSEPVSFDKLRVKCSDGKHYDIIYNRR